MGNRFMNTGLFSFPFVFSNNDSKQYLWDKTSTDR